MTAHLLLPALRQPRGLLAPVLPEREPALTGDPSLFDQHSRAIHVFTERGTITHTNPAFDAMFGSSRRRYVGRHQAALNSASVEANLRLLAEIRTAVDSRGVWEGTLQNRRGNGFPFATRAQVHPMQLDGGRCLVCFQEEVKHGYHSSA